MNMIIAGFTLIAGLASATIAPAATSQVLPAQNTILSKDEIVKIIANEHREIQNLNTYAINLPKLTLEMRIAKNTPQRRNSATLILNKKTASTDE
jgi:hypothetical protein